MKTISVIAIIVFFATPHLRSADVVVIDPGHGGETDSGSEALRSLSSCNNATSPSGLKEKDLTLELALEVKKQLESLKSGAAGAPINCILTRETDENPDFALRAKTCAATAEVPRAIVSIHFNASDNGRALGTVAMVEDESRNDNYQADLRLAQILTAAVNKVVGPLVPNSGAREPISDRHLHGGLGSNFFSQLRRHKSLKKVPKCFIEIEFIDRKDVETKLLNNRKRAFPDIARAIAMCLVDYVSPAPDRNIGAGS